MRSKVLIIIVALVLGGLAAVLAANYLQSARGNITAESEPIGVLVAQEDLPRGLNAAELIDRELVTEEKVPRRFVAGDAISSVRQIEDQVLAVPVGAGEQLTKNRFQYPSQAGLAYTVPENYVALSVDVDAVTGISGLLKPGDSVVVYATYKDQGEDRVSFTTMTIGRAKVLAVGAETSAESAAAPADEDQDAGALAANRSIQPEGSVAYQTVTMALSPAEAQKVVFARNVGEIQLALLPKNAEAPGALNAVTLGTVNANSLRSVLK